MTTSAPARQHTGRDLSNIISTHPSTELPRLDLCAECEGTGMDAPHRRDCAFVHHAAPCSCRVPKCLACKGAGEITRAAWRQFTRPSRAQ